MAKVKTEGIFFGKKISWSQMIQNCLIRRKMAVIGGSNLQNQKIRVCYHKTSDADPDPHFLDPDPGV